MMGTLSIEQLHSVQRAEGQLAECACTHVRAEHDKPGGACRVLGCRCLAFQQAKKPHKYKARSCVIDGIRFPSQKQGNRYAHLKLLERSGVIEDLKVDGPETTFRLQVNGILVCHYRADATYKENGQRVVEDSKGFATDSYRLKKRLMLACLGIEIRET